MFYNYLLRSDVNGRYYIGQTQDLEARVVYHNAGRVKSTARLRPWRMLWYMKQESRSAAVIRECKMKNLKSRKRTEEFMRKHGTLMPGSAEFF